MNGKSIDDILRASDLSQFLSQAQSDNTNVEVGMSMRANNTPAQLTMSQARPVIVAPGLGLLESADIFKGASLIGTGTKKMMDLLKSMSKRSKDTEGFAQSVASELRKQKSGKQSVDQSVQKVAELLQNIRKKDVQMFDDIEAFAPREAVSLSPEQAGSLINQRLFSTAREGTDSFNQLQRNLTDELNTLFEATKKDANTSRILKSMMERYDRTGVPIFTPKARGN